MSTLDVATSPARPLRRRSFARPRFDALIPLVGPLGFLALWEAICASHLVKVVLLPTPQATLTYLVDALFHGSLAGDTLVTLGRTLEAFAIGSIAGVPIGIAFGSSVRLYRSVEFVVDFFRSTPASALIPLFILFFGIDDFNKVAIASFAVFLIVMFNSAYGVMNARRARVLAARVMGASAFAIFRDVLVFESLPQTCIGLRNGISTALVIVVVAEMFIGSDRGLGHRIIEGEQILHVTDMYASILIAGLLGYLLNVLFVIADRRLIHWNGK